MRLHGDGLCRHGARVRVNQPCSGVIVLELQRTNKITDGIEEMREARESYRKIIYIQKWARAIAIVKVAVSTTMK